MTKHIKKRERRRGGGHIIGSTVELKGSNKRDWKKMHKRDWKADVMTKQEAKYMGDTEEEDLP